MTCTWLLILVKSNVMKRYFLSFLFVVSCLSVSAGSDSVTVVLNSGIVSRGKLVSRSDGTVVVSQNGNEYPFTSKSARTVVSDDGEYLIGALETQSDYNRRVREARIRNSNSLMSEDRYMRMELGFSMNELSGNFNCQKYSITARSVHRVGDSNMFWDWGASIGFSHSGVSRIDSIASTGGFPGGTGGFPGGAGGIPGGNSAKVAVENKVNTTVFALEVPVRLSYHFACGKFALAPFAGIVGKFNLYDDVSVVSSDSASAMSSSGGSGISQLKNGEAEKFQLAYCTGLELLSEGRISAGITWQGDITDYTNDGFSGIGLQLGVRF